LQVHPENIYKTRPARAILKPVKIPLRSSSTTARRSSTTTSRAAISPLRAVVRGVRNPRREVRPRDAMTPLRVPERSRRMDSMASAIAVGEAD